MDNEPSWGGLQPAVIIAADKKSAKVIAQNGELYRLSNKKALGAARRYLPGGRKPTLTPGAVVWLAGDGETARLAALPNAEAAIVALSPEDGLVLAMAGGFDFGKNQFNHVTQAKRQPGSGIKPFVYSAALEKGFMSANILPDTPIFLSPPRKPAAVKVGNPKTTTVNIPDSYPCARLWQNPKTWPR